jgi:hypothetical protein
MKRFLKKTLFWTLVVGPLCILLQVLVISPAQERGKRQNDAEIYMLRVIEGDLQSLLYTGKVFPTNWQTFSNSVKWDLVEGICSFNSLPPPTNLYCVLRDPVFYNDGGYTGRIFLVRSKPYKNQSHQFGRWALMKGHQLQVENHYGFGGSSNDVSRVWLDENKLPASIRSQLAN